MKTPRLWSLVGLLGALLFLTSCVDPGYAGLYQTQAPLSGYGGYDTSSAGRWSAHPWDTSFPSGYYAGHAPAYASAIVFGHRSRFAPRRHRYRNHRHADHHRADQHRPRYDRRQKRREQIHHRHPERVHPPSSERDARRQSERLARHLRETRKGVFAPPTMSPPRERRSTRSKRRKARTPRVQQPRGERNRKEKRRDRKRPRPKRNPDLV